MFTDEDLDAAIRSGDITPEGAAAIRRSAAERVAAVQSTVAERIDPAPVEGEQLRLVTGFHDVSVAGAALLTLACLVFFTASNGVAATGLVAAAAAWALAEHFTRARRLALTSILLMLVVVAGAGAVALGLTGAGGLGAARLYGLSRGYIEAAALENGDAAALATAAVASALHWMRFRVPAAMGTMAATSAGLALVLLLMAAPAAAGLAKPLAFTAGLAVFAFAMRWDLSDPARRTARSDVAFWLHLAAAPMIVGPAFAAIGAHTGAVSPGTAMAAIALYAGISVVALTIDRRALMASALFYLLAAVGSLLASRGQVMTTVALTGLVVGPALLLLSAFWGSARRAVLSVLPGWLARRLPPSAGDPAAPSASAGPAAAA